MERGVNVVLLRLDGKRLARANSCTTWGFRDTLGTVAVRRGTIPLSPLEVRR
jgi:hypothetical protein